MIVLVDGFCDNGVGLYEFVLLVFCFFSLVGFVYNYCFIFIELDFWDRVCYFIGFF